MLPLLFSSNAFFAASVAPALQGSWWLPVKPASPRAMTRTGGPDDDDGDDDDLRWLMPLLTVVIVLAVIFG